MSNSALSSVEFLDKNGFQVSGFLTKKCLGGCCFLGHSSAATLNLRGFLRGQNQPGVIVGRIPPARMLSGSLHALKKAIFDVQEE